jgi:hypothetical protein
VPKEKKIVDKFAERLAASQEEHSSMELVNVSIFNTVFFPI